MKSIALCACILILASSLQSAKLKLLKHAKEATMEDNIRNCMIEENVTHDDVYRVEEIMSDMHREPGNEEKRNKNGCFISCVLKKRNLMEGSSIKEEDVLATLGELFDDPDAAHDMVQKCLEEVRNMHQECEKSFELYVCTIKSAQAKRAEHKKKGTEGKEDTTQVE